MSDWKPPRPMATRQPMAARPPMAHTLVDPEPLPLTAQPSRGLVTQAMLSAQTAQTVQRIADAITAAVAKRNIAGAGALAPGRLCRMTDCIRPDCRFAHATPPSAEAVRRLAERLATRPRCAANASACRNGLACTYYECTYMHDSVGASKDAEPKSKSPLLILLGVEPKFDPDSVMPDEVGDQDQDHDHDEDEDQDEDEYNDQNHLNAYVSGLEEKSDCDEFIKARQAEKIAELEAKIAKLEVKLHDALACKASPFVPSVPSVPSAPFVPSARYGASMSYAAMPYAAAYGK